MNDLVYALNAESIEDGLVSITLPENSVFSAEGFGNNQVSFSYIYDNIAPVFEFDISTNSPTNDTLIISQLVFNEEVTGSISSGLSSNNCLIDSLSRTDTSFTFYIITENTGTVSISVIQNIFYDIAGNNNQSGDSLVFYYDNSPPEVSINSPNQGSSFSIGDSVFVSWSMQDDYALDSAVLSFKAYDEWILLSDNAHTINEFSWLVPNLITDSLVLRLEALDMVGFSDTSIVDNISIEAVYPQIALVSPGNEDTLGIGDITTISWEDTSSLSLVSSNIFYKVGSNWNNIVSLQNEVNQFEWLVPNEPTDNLQLKIVGENEYGYKDSTEIQGINIIPDFPMVNTFYPQPG